MIVIFCDNLIDHKVDPDFEGEFNSAICAGFRTALISFETLNTSNVSKALSRVPTSEFLIPGFYRGWMLSVEKYKLLYETLILKNIRLINDPAEYETCHHLPNNYQFIKDRTPLTRWIPLAKISDFNNVFAVTDLFGDEPIIVKDYIKSQKHNWNEACFIPDASDHAYVKKIVSKFIELQGDSLTGGLVFRKYDKLQFITNHSKSGMPLAKEYRLFFCCGKLIGSYEYWEEGEYSETPDFAEFITLAEGVKSHFFTMDVAQRQEGGWIVMELGDGQVSGLPQTADITSFFEKLQLIVR